MKKIMLVLLGLLLVLYPIGMVLAANTAQQTVTFEVTSISEITVSGDPASLVVNSATAGSEPTPDTDNSTNWAITTNQNNRKMTGVINSDMPTDVTLEINLTAPTGGLSAGDVSLSTTAADLVTSIERIAQSGLTITYTLSALISAGVIAQDTRTVTLTLTAE